VLEPKKDMLRCAGRKHEGLQEAIANLQLELDRTAAARDSAGERSERLRAQNVKLEAQLANLQHVQVCHGLPFGF
jgi:septal ring factor EnvC (AmiA/AmiB activator)